MLSPARRRQCVDHLQAELGISERRACAVAGQHRLTQRKRPRGRDDEEALTAAIIRLASQYGRYGYRRITALLRTEGWHVNAKRVQRIWRREGLKLPQKQPKRGRLWLNDRSCIRLRPCWPNHVWSYDFVMDRTHDGRKFRVLTVIDEFTRRCMAVVVERRLNSDNVLHCLTELFVQHGPPDHIRSDNGSEFTAHAVRDWLGRTGVKTLYIEPGSPCGERIQRELQLKAPGRNPEHGDLLYTEGGQSADRTMAASLQYHPATQLARIQTAGSGNHLAKRWWANLRC